MLKDDIFKASDVKTRLVHVPEWGVDLFVKTMSGTERSRFKCQVDVCSKQGKDSDVDAWLVVYTACDSNGNRIFEDKDFERLNERNAMVLSTVAKQALVVNGLMPDAIDIEKKD